MTQDFFAVDDYGQGGIWMVICAESRAAVEHAYPELTVFDSAPDFLSADARSEARQKRYHDLKDAPTGYLAELVADRR